MQGFVRARGADAPKLPSSPAVVAVAAAAASAAAPVTAPLGAPSSQQAARPALPADPEQEAAPTRVLLLRNMVGPGEVDGALDGEVKQECGAKYGAVAQCVIFEVRSQSVRPEARVRIFVQFAELAGAQRAHADLNGRFFGGRCVQATFFSEPRFAKLDLAPIQPPL